MGASTSAELPFSPGQRKQLACGMFASEITEAATQAPTLVIFEDAQWMDPSTRKVLDRLIASVSEHRVLLLATRRPEFDSVWSDRGSVLRVGQLDRLAARALVERVATRPLSEALVQEILVKADGIALFVEELTKSVVEATVPLTSAAPSLTDPVRYAPLAVPSTLHDSLMARLDRLASVKEVAQTASVFGREFSHHQLVVLSPLPPDELDNALAQLTAAGLLYEGLSGPTLSFSFKHALVRDAAYDSLLVSRRCLLHARAAEVLKGSSDDARESDPALVAHHLTEAGLAEPAWIQAGTQARQRSAQPESLAHFTRALSMLPDVVDYDARLDLELPIQTALGATYMAIKGYGSPRARAGVAVPGDRRRTRCSNP